MPSRGGYAKYTAQMIVMAEPELAGEVNAWAVKSGQAKSELLRDAFGRGWQRVRKGLEDEYGRLSTEDRRYGVLMALRPRDRQAYAERYGLSWDDPRCQVSQDGRGAAPLRPVAAAAE